MKQGTFLLLLILCMTCINAQTLQKVVVGKTGVSLSSFCKMSFDISRSKDSSIVYNSECKTGEITYGVICVKLLNPRTDMADAEALTAAYLDYLNTSFNITHAEGYQKGLKLNKDERTRGISDNWADAKNNKWMVRAWTNGIFITVLYASSIGILAPGKIDPFLNSVRFP